MLKQKILAENKQLKTNFANMIEENVKLNAKLSLGGSKFQLPKAIKRRDVNS